MWRLGGKRWVMLVVAWCGAAYPAQAQISPGPLSRAHQQWEGPTRCGACHVFGFGARRFRCLDCHSEIAQRLEQNRGYHATLMRGSKNSADCVRCHAEHYGRQLDIVKWEGRREDFDHAKTGYVLEGKHRRLACPQCHQPRLIDPAQRSVIRVKDLARTFLGLRTECGSCHEDVHRGELGGDCRRCHSFETWKEPPGFNHDATDFPLTGLHRRVACTGCHRRREAEALRFSGLAFDSCVNCHRDPHNGAFQEPAFSGGCASCHTSAGWKPAKGLTSFNHGRTAFPLKGRHASLGCFKCHQNSNFAAPLAHDQCLDCHVEAHQGQFAQRADKGDCRPCHDETSFQKTLFSREDHQKTGFALLGKHWTLKCADCHKPSGAATRYKLPFDACTRCHQDAHAGQFLASYGNRCEQCHGVDSFHPSSFSVARHEQTRFPLTGRHRDVACGKCHMSKQAGASGEPRVYLMVGELPCQRCHEDPHAGPLPPRSEQLLRLTCDSCHSTGGWKQTAPFDHSRTRFALTGAHRAVACIDCHRPATAAKALLFAGQPTQCQACHEDPHGGQFAAGGRALQCDACHTVNSWKPTTFDHERTAFPLSGAHRNVACSGCHQTKRWIQGKLILIYQETPRKCAACHANERAH